jgi:hypothetical protein
MTPDDRLVAEGLWYLERIAQTGHEGVAAVLARYHHLERIERLAQEQSDDVQANWLSPVEAAGLRAEVARLSEACDRIARAGLREVDARDLGY